MSGGHRAMPYRSASGCYVQTRIRAVLKLLLEPGSEVDGPAATRPARLQGVAAGSWQVEGAKPDVPGLLRTARTALRLAWIRREDGPSIPGHRVWSGSEPQRVLGVQVVTSDGDRLGEARRDQHLHQDRPAVGRIRGA